MYMWYIGFNWQESNFFCEEVSMGFFHKVKPFIANLLQFFLELNRNIDKDDVIDKFLDFQNAFDSLLILLQLCMCDVGDTAGSKMNHCLTMAVLMFFWCCQDDSSPVYPCRCLIASVVGFQQNRIFLSCKKHKAITSGPGYLLLLSVSPRISYSVPLNSSSVYAWAEGSLLRGLCLLCHRNPSSNNKPLPWQAGIFCFLQGPTFPS